jgi:phospholipase/carboxylesterase
MADSHLGRTGIHQGEPVLAAGKPLSGATAAAVLLHGRGASAVDILTLTREFAQPNFAYLAPQAKGGTWYPSRFLDPVISNEPYLSSALDRVGHVMSKIQSAGIPPERIILLGFSQGACLALEWAARNAVRYGGVVGLSGGVIGADTEPRHDYGSLDGTPVFLGCSDPDPHIPRYRLEKTGEILGSLGGIVTTRLYPGLGHTINQDEIDFVRRMMETVYG